MPPENTDSAPITPHKKSRLWMVLAILAALLSVGLGIALWYALAAKQPVTLPTGVDTQASVTEKLTATFGLASTTHKPGELIDQFSFSATAPKAWRTVDASQRNTSASLLNDPLIEKSNDMLLDLAMVAEDRTGTGNEILATNTLQIRDITNWSRKSDGESTSAQRQKALEYIAAQGSVAEPKQMPGETQGLLAINRGLIGGPFMRAKGISTADGSLKGVVYLTIGVQAISYDPVASVVMTGMLNGKQVLLSGRFDIIDKQSRDFGATPEESLVRKVQDSFKQGNIPEDTGNYYQNIADALATIEIKKK